MRLQTKKLKEIQDGVVFNNHDSVVGAIEKLNKLLANNIKAIERVEILNYRDDLRRQQAKLREAKRTPTEQDIKRCSDMLVVFANYRMILSIKRTFDLQSHLVKNKIRGVDIANTLHADKRVISQMLNGQQKGIFGKSKELADRIKEQFGVDVSMLRVTIEAVANDIQNRVSIDNKLPNVIASYRRGVPALTAQKEQLIKDAYNSLIQDFINDLLAKEC